MSKEGLDAFSPAEIAEKVETVGVAKANLPWLQTVLLGLLAGAFIGLGMLLTRMIAAPVTAMTAAMRRLAQGDFTAAVPAMGRKDEVGQMASAVTA